MNINRRPIKYFITQGSGTSDYTEHAGSFHVALWDAGLDRFNLIPYSSVISKDAKLIPIPEFTVDDHGREMMYIQACAKGASGDVISAGIVYGNLYLGGELYGKIVCEETGAMSKEDMGERLHNVIHDMFRQTYGTRSFELRELEYYIETLSIPKNKKYGCALVALCFTEYD